MTSGEHDPHHVTGQSALATDAEPAESSYLRQHSPSSDHFIPFR